MRNWKTIKEYKEILFDEFNGIARITINRPRYRNAFTPLTVWEMSQALAYCRECQDICVVVLTGAGDKAFCSACPGSTSSTCRSRYARCLSPSSPW